MSISCWSRRPVGVLRSTRSPWRSGSASSWPTPPRHRSRGDLMSTATVPLDAPADTRMMGIVHSALRRDLRRAQVAWSRRYSRPRPSRPRGPGRPPALVHGVPPPPPHRRGRRPLPHGRATRTRARPSWSPTWTRTTRRSLRPSAVSRTPHASSPIRPRDRAASRRGHHLVRGAPPAPGARGAGDDAGGLGQHHRGTVAFVHGGDEAAAQGLGELAFEGHWLLDGLDAESRDHVEHLVPPSRGSSWSSCSAVRTGASARLWNGTTAGRCPP